MFQQRVRDALVELARAMEPDGGGADVVAIADGSVTLKLIGTCVFCPSRVLSAAALAAQLRERVPDVIHVDLIYPAEESLHHAK